ncbi:MAG TPA: YceI family protein [Chitinophagales bacterium]|nr:YceI family protein [Chitinophagales bacterium]
MKAIQLTALALLISAASYAQNWHSDNAHSKLGFTVVHMLVTDVEGQFKTFNLKVTSAKDDFSDAKIELTADVNSINTDNDKRDEHLKTPDFFDAAKYGTLSFKSTSFTKAGNNTYKLVGDLTLHGVTKQVTLDVKLNGTTIHPMTKKKVAGFKVTGTFKRSDFGVGSNTPGAIVSDEVTLVANIELDQD